MLRGRSPQRAERYSSGGPSYQDERPEYPRRSPSPSQARFSAPRGSREGRPREDFPAPKPAYTSPRESFGSREPPREVYRSRGSDSFGSREPVARESYTPRDPPRREGYRESRELLPREGNRSDDPISRNGYVPRDPPKRETYGSKEQIRESYGSRDVPRDNHGGPGQRESFGSRDRSQSSYSSRDVGPRPKGAYGSSSTSREAYGSSSAYSGPVARRGSAGSPSRGFAFEARPTSTR